MPAFENSITTELIAYIIYAIKPTVYITFLIRIFIYNTVTMFGTGLLQFFLQPFFIYRVHRLISFIANITSSFKLYPFLFKTFCKERIAVLGPELTEKS